jgi:hypothetical protein
MPGPRNSPKAFTDWYESDYFRRPRRPWLLTGTILAAMAVAVTAIVLTFARPGGMAAYQAGPLSDPHAFLANNCDACHTEKFVTAGRLLPGHDNDRATPDDACLQCHKAGVHHPNQTHFVGTTGRDGQSAANCAGCHHEHNGGASIARFGDRACTACHADVQTTDDQRRFASSVTRFDRDHPPFGAWRVGADPSGNYRIGDDGKVQWTDPGTLKFSHKAHLNLAKDFDASTDRNSWMAGALNRLKELQCTACHEPDNDRRYIRSVNFDRHCAECHPLTLPAGDLKDRLHHPQRGETAEVVRAELLRRFWDKLVAQKPPPPPLPPDNVLNRGLPPLSAEQKAQVQKLAREEEARQFDPAGYDLPTLERPQFTLKSGCAYCHEEKIKVENSPDGLPVYKAPGLRDRWKDVKFPHERFGADARRTAAEQIARDRWFPYAKFSHETHRILDCAGCHVQAKESVAAKDVLMPTIDICQKCHNHTTAGVRSDCLECHNYHDRGAEPHGLNGRMDVNKVLDLTRPGGGRP